MVPCLISGCLTRYSSGHNFGDACFIIGSQQGCPICNDQCLPGIFMINTILRNLLANAIKFTPQLGKIFVSLAKNDEFYEVSIKDNGIGIAEENIHKLFRIDSKFTTLGTEKERGTGLGLILCKEFVEKHGGRIWAKSELGKGSTFIFSLKR